MSGFTFVNKDLLKPSELVTAINPSLPRQHNEVENAHLFRNTAIHSNGLVRGSDVTRDILSSIKSRTEYPSFANALYSLSTLGSCLKVPEAVNIGVTCTRYSLPSGCRESDPAEPAGQSPFIVLEK